LSSRSVCAIVQVDRVARARVTAVGLLTAALAAASAASAQPPPGATAQCRDGTYSFSRHHSGTCSYHGGVAVWLDGSGTRAVTLGRTIVLAPVERVRGCRPGPEPDRRCSPGAVYSGLTSAALCSASFRTQSIRIVPEWEKLQVERAYALPARAYGRTIEIDHIVSLELGGSNAVANLYPEPGNGSASYHAKDRLENRLHAMVCAGAISLRRAQEEIARDWIALYRRVFGTPPAG